MHNLKEIPSFQCHTWKHYHQRMYHGRLVDHLRLTQQTDP